MAQKYHINWTSEYDEGDLDSAREYFELSINDPEFIGYKDLFPWEISFRHHPICSRSEFGWGKNLSPAKLEKELYARDDREFFLSDLKKGRIQTPVIIIDGHLGDGLGRVLLSVALGEKVRAALFKTNTPEETELSGKKIKAFTITAYKRWNSQEEQTLRDMFMSGREQGIPHKQLWEEISYKLDRTPTEVQRKLIRMYRDNDDLKQYKQEDWSKEKILNQLKDLYLSNQPMNKNSLPEKLKFILLKNRDQFGSPDTALAEAVLSAGYARNEDGSLDKDSPIESIEDALEYIRLGHKKRHVWSLDEVKEVLSALHEADYPITLPFLTNHYGIYKSALGVNRKLESFKDVIKKFIEDGSIKSYSDLVCTIAPEYIAYYNPDKSRLKLSTEEIRVKKFLDRYKISYIIPRLSDKISTGLETFANFVPDFIITDSNKNPLAIIEVFGSIGDRENANVGSIYNDKTQAKLEFYKTLPLKFVEVHNNGGRCDLDDSSLLDRLGSFISFVAQVKQASSNKVEDLKDLVKIQCTDGTWNYDPYMQGMANGLIVALSVLTDDPNPQFIEAPDKWLSEKYDLQDLVTSSIDKASENIEKYGCAIIYTASKKYKLISKGAQDFRFDSLFQIPVLTPKNPALKEIIHRLIEKQKTHKNRPFRSPSEQSNDYQPFVRPTEFDTDLGTPIPENSNGSGVVG